MFRKYVTFASLNKKIAKRVRGYGTLTTSTT